MTGEMRSLIWQTIGFLQGISGEIPRAEDYATRLLEQMGSYDIEKIREIFLDSDTVTLKTAPTTYTDTRYHDCSWCGEYPCPDSPIFHADCLGFKPKYKEDTDECEACEVKV